MRGWLRAAGGASGGGAHRGPIGGPAGGPQGEKKKYSKTITFLKNVLGIPNYEVSQSI